MSGRKSIVIVGAGPSGLAMAVLLARRGHTVSVFESRPDPRLVSLRDSRSINLTLSTRGLTVLNVLGVAEQVMAHSNKIGSRLIHARSGQVFYQRYGARKCEILYGITRETFLLLMLERVAQEPNVTVRFGTRFVDLDKSTGAVTLQKSDSPETFFVRPDLVIGADGVHSQVRHQMNKGEMVDLHREHFAWTYKEIIISSTQAHLLNLRADVLHVWPRPNSLLVAFANTDGSFGCNLFLDSHSAFAHSSFADGRQMERFLTGAFADLLPVVADLASQLLAQRDSGIVRVRTSRWRYEGKAVIIGDAAHAIYQFYGHGTSADLEDCRILDQCLIDCPEDAESAFRHFESLRSEDTWELSELSRRHFYALKDQTASAAFRARLATDILLARIMPRWWHLEYALVAHSSTPYAEITRTMNRQRRIWRWSGLWLVTGIILLRLYLESIAFFVGRRPRRRPRTHPLRVKAA